MKKNVPSAPTKKRLLLALVTLIVLSPAVVGDKATASPEAFEISWASIDDRTFTMQGGFFAIQRVDDLFEDGFETGDASRWSRSSR